LAVVSDTNPVDNTTISGYTNFPGLVRTNTFTLINPSSDVTVNNLVGSILIPNTEEPGLEYRIIRQDAYQDSYGDINNDGVIDADDVTRCLEIGDIVSGDGYSKDLQSGSVPSANQLNAILNETVTMEEIIRADVMDTGVVTTLDAAAIQQYISLGTAFTAGTTFTRVVLTVENVTNPLTTSPDIIGSDSSFNDVPFTAVSYRIDFIPRWTESNIVITDLRRFVPKTFTEIESTDITATTKSGGKNIAYVPDDLILGGDLLDEDSNPYSIDLEVNTIIVELPDGDTEGELDLFSEYISGTMKFGDGTYVGASAITNNQVKMEVAVSSIVKNLDGYDYDGYIDEVVSCLLIQSTGLLRIRARNVRLVSTRPELRTRIIISVFLKKAGFQNTNVAVSATEVDDLLIPL
jgi:hypothetical protein